MMGAQAAQSVPKLPRGVKLRFDGTRQKWFLLGPERVFEPDEIATEILQRIDGARSLAAIIRELASEFGAPEAEISGDVGEFVDKLVGIRMLELSRPAS